MKTLACCFFLVVAIGFCNAQKIENTNADKLAITEASNKFSNYYMAGDYDGLARMYSKDAKILPPGALILEGQETIRNQWKLPDGVRILHHKSVSEEIEIMGDLAYDMGYYEGQTQKADGQKESWRGKYVIIWKREDREWKMYIDIWNRVNI